MRKTAIFFIIVITTLSWLYRIPAAHCSQDTSYPAGLYGTLGHKASNHKSCDITTSDKTCGLEHVHHMRHGDGRACRAHIRCSHAAGSNLGSTLPDEDYSPTRIEFASYYSIISYNPDSELISKNELTSPVERPPAL